MRSLKINRNPGFRNNQDQRAREELQLPGKARGLHTPDEVPRVACANRQALTVAAGLDAVHVGQTGPVRRDLVAVCGIAVVEEGNEAEEGEMAALSEYSNVYNSALLILQKKGFQTWYDKEAQLYCAEKNGWDFMAETPCGLLGVVAIYEYKQPTEYSEYWWREEGPDLYKTLPTEPRPYRAVTGRPSPA